MIEAYRKYKHFGLECLPCKENKSPASPKSWTETTFTEIDFKNQVAIGVKCGIISGGLECFDFDNHFNDALTVLTAFITQPDVKTIYDKYKLPIEKTQRGGYHLLFRCKKNDGNKKLAQRLNKENKPEALIETRGEGGYFCAYPSPNYTIFRNDIFTIAEISIIERAILIDNAIALNEYFKAFTVTEYEGTERPGDLFNKSNNTEYEIKSILRSNGWVELDAKKWRRPGKSDGISASLDYINSQLLFYCFTSSGSPFEPMKAYTPFQIKGLLEYNGDFKACATALPKPEKITIISKEKLSESEIDKILSINKIDTNKNIDRPPIILSIKDNYGTQSRFKRVFTLGNFSVIFGKAKTKKTFLISLIVSILLKIRDMSGKLINEIEGNKNKILWFDTEQGEYDSWNVIKRVERLSGTKENLLAFNLRSFTPIERCQIIEYALSKYGNETALCIIDGIADLSNAINDELEATRISSMMLRLTKEYNIHCCIVIHQNKNDNFATGHLGSSLMKKAEILISTNKVAGGYDTEVVCDMSRGEGFEPFAFGIDNEGLPFITELEKKENTVPNYYERESLEINISNSIDKNEEFDFTPIKSPF